MAEAFTHLHVPSAFGARPEGARPDEFVARAVADGASALACTDRDGLYGAAKHFRACERAGIDAIAGVDLAVLAEPVAEGRDEDEAGHDGDEGHGAGVHGAVEHDDATRPGARRVRRGSAGVAGRVVVLAHGHDGGSGWKALCRLVSDAHAHTGGRSNGRAPIGILRSELAARCLDPDTGKPILTVLIGPDSDVGRALTGARFLRPRTLFREWLEVMPAGVLAVELVTHLSAPGKPFSTGHAVRMLRLASEHAIPAVLTNAVRSSEEGDAGNDWLKPAAAMHALGRQIIHAAGHGAQDLANLLGNTERIADRCRLELAGDVGWGRPSIPEASVIGIAGKPDGELAERCRDGIGRRFPVLGDAEKDQLLRRLDHELDLIARLGFASSLLTVAEVVETIRGVGVRSAIRGSGASSLVNYLLGISQVDPFRYHLSSEGFLSHESLRPLDIGLDVESAQRDRVLRKIVERLGAERVMLMRAPSRARDRSDVRDNERTSQQLELVADPGRRPHESPPHMPVDSCGIILGDATLRGRMPVQPGGNGLPMSQFDRDDLEVMGVFSIDIVGAPLQSAMAFAVREVARIDGEILDLDALPLDDDAAVRLLRSADGLSGPERIEACETAEAASDVSAYQSAWLAAHHPEAFLAGLLEHTSGSHPERPLVAEARRRGIQILPVDVNASRNEHRLERIESGPQAGTLGIRSTLKVVKGLSEAERRRIVEGQPYASIADLRDRARLTHSSLRRLGELGAFDSLHRKLRARESRADLVAHLARLAERPSSRRDEPIEGQLALAIGPDEGALVEGAS